MNTGRTYTTAQLGSLIGSTPQVHRLAHRLDLEHPKRGVWSMCEALGILVAQHTAPGAHAGRSHDVSAAHSVMRMVGRGYRPRWVLWCAATGWVRASPLKLEALWPSVPREALELGSISVLDLEGVLAELEGV